MVSGFAEERSRLKKERGDGLSWAWLILKVLLFIICSVGGYFIAAQMESLSEYHWAPWAGSLIGIVAALMALSVEKLIKHMPLKGLLGGTIGLVHRTLHRETHWLWLYWPG